MPSHQRSPSPKNIVSRSARERHGGGGGGPANMLDVAAVELAKNPGKPFNRNAERITCTIAGNRGSVRDRMTGYEHGDRRVSMKGSIVKREFHPMNRKERRATLAQRLTRDNDDHRRRRDDVEDWRRKDDVEDERKNGHFRDEQKPVQRLIDPTFVPKSRAFFDHDDRESGEQWKGKSLYNPAIDFGPRHNRHRGNWDGFGDRRDRDRDGRNDRYSRYNRADDRRDRRPIASYANSRREGYDDRNGGAEGLWTHDKFMELEEDNGSSKGPTIVVDTRKSSNRRIVSED